MALTEAQLEQIAGLVSIWNPMIGMAAMLGVKSFSVIKAMIQDAHSTEPDVQAELIRQLQPKWDDLSMRVRRAAGL